MFVETEEQREIRHMVYELHKVDCVIVAPFNQYVIAKTVFMSNDNHLALTYHEMQNIVRQIKARYDKVTFTEQFHTVRDTTQFILSINWRSYGTTK